MKGTSRMATALDGIHVLDLAQFTPGQPIKLSRTPARAGGELAEPGQHNGEVYGILLGITSTQLATWATTGVI